MTSDPFQSATGSTIVADGDPFMQPAGSAKYPKIEELFGRLLMMTGTKVEPVAKPERFGGKPGDTVERATIDLIVLDGEDVNEEPIPAEFADMFISQESLVGAIKGGMRKGRMVLGRLYRFPTKDSVAEFPTRQAVEEGFKAWVARGGMGAKPGFTWKLEQYTEADREIALAYINAKKSDPFAAK